MVIMLKPTQFVKLYACGTWCQVTVDLALMWSLRLTSDKVEVQSSNTDKITRLMI